MALSNKEVQDRIKAPRQKNQLQRAIKHEQRLRFHAQEAENRQEASRYLFDFEAWVKGLLPSDKAQFFSKMMNFPLYTNSLCTSMLDEFNKVFDSQNSSFTYDFTSESFEADFRGYLDDMNFWEKWQHNSKESMLKRVCSVCVIDMPAEPGAETEPYFYFQDISGVIDLDYHAAYYKRGKENLEYTVIDSIILDQGPDKRLMIDDKRYAIFEKRNGDWVFTREAFHNLGYCPACFFWQDAINKDYPIVKKSLITGALGSLDFLLLGETSRRCNELGAAFPIIVSYKENCTYYKEIDNNRYTCRSGYLDTPKGQFNCPVCEKNKLIGPGTVFKVNPPRDKNEPNNINAVNIVSPDEVSLKFWADRTDGLWDEIFYDCVGSGGDTMVQAVNEDQAHGNFESKMNILLKAKSNIEVSHQFVVATMARLRYEGSFVSCSINYGTKFYLQSSEAAQAEMKTAKEAGAPAYQVSYKRQQVDMVNTKGNPVDAERLRILQHLEPWVDYSLEEVSTLVKNPDPAKLSLKEEFSSRILQFEAEYGSIIEFASKKDFKSKIDIINKVLIGYGQKEPITTT